MNALIVLLAIITFFVLAYDTHWSIPYSCKILLLDRSLFSYPLFSSIVVYATGFAIANSEISYKRNLFTFKMVCFIFIILCIHLFLSTKVQIYGELVHNEQNFTLIESITPYMAILILRYLTTTNSLFKYLSSPYVLCVGILSLHFYVISNVLIGLISLSKESELLIELLALIGVSFLSYMLTLWRFNSLTKIELITRRSTDYS
jgi:hypothetical protein